MLELCLVPAEGINSSLLKSHNLSYMCFLYWSTRPKSSHYL